MSLPYRVCFMLIYEIKYISAAIFSVFSAVPKMLPEMRKYIGYGIKKELCHIPGLFDFLAGFQPFFRYTLDR